MHPGPQIDVAVGWRSPISGQVSVKARVAHAQHGGDGIAWSIQHGTKSGREILDDGSTDGTGFRAIPSDRSTNRLDRIPVAPGDMVSLAVGPKGNYYCDSTLIEFVISEVGGSGRIWDLTRDVVDSIHANPHRDSLGNADVWHFYTENSRAMLKTIPTQPPIELGSKAGSAREFIHELQGQKLLTIREQISVHPEQTWESAVGAMHGGRAAASSAAARRI